MQRAESVAAWLRRQQGLADIEYTVDGFGAARPVAPNAGPTARTIRPDARRTGGWRSFCARASARPQAPKGDEGGCEVFDSTAVNGLCPSPALTSLQWPDLLFRVVNGTVIGTYFSQAATSPSTPPKKKFTGLSLSIT